jgi:peptidoglycan/xylan/chitin deacetylase (PgdA/CDA1 family)
MDHPHYAYRARPANTTAAPGPRPVRAFVLLVLEHWDAEAGEQGLRDPRFVGEFGSFSPDYRSWTQREYGLRIGVFRVLEALAEAGIVPAVAADARVLERLPALVARLQALGVEWVGHGVGATHLMHSRMPLSEQQAQVAAGLDAVRRATGGPALGWLSQDWGTTPDTFALLAQAGVRYTLDWCNDDAPFPLRTTPAMTALPLSAEWDDVQAQWLRHLTPRTHADLARAALLRLAEESRATASPAVFGLSLHPWLCGMSSRIGPMRALLREIARMDGVEWTLPGRIVDAPLGAPVSAFGIAPTAASPSPVFPLPSSRAASADPPDVK